MLGGDTQGRQEDEKNAKNSEDAETVMVEEDTKQGEKDVSNTKHGDNAEILQDKFSHLKNLTRAELAAVKLPNVAFFFFRKRGKNYTTSKYSRRCW